MTSPVSDAVGTTLQRALDGLALRQRVIANDVANVETPGYKAHRVDFESSLRSAVADGDPSSATASVQTSLEPTQLDGNNVNLDEETLQGQAAGLQYQLVSQAVTNRFALMKSVIGAGA